MENSMAIQNEKTLYDPDFLPLLSGRSFLRKMRALIQFNYTVRMIPLHSRRILEVGCGYGGLSTYLSRTCREVYAVDINESIIDKAKKMTEGIVFAAMDAQHLEFPDGMFDAIVSFHTIEHVADTKSFMEELSRVTRPGGVIILGYPYEPFRGAGALPNCLLRHGSFSLAQKYHLHRITPGVLNQHLLNMKLSQTDWKLVFDGWPTFVSFVRKER